jgi:hypothetical protein
MASSLAVLELAVLKAGGAQEMRIPCIVHCITGYSDAARSTTVTSWPLMRVASAMKSAKLRGL